MAAIATALAVVALVLALDRPTASSLPATTGKPAYTAAETAAAQRQLCTTYRLAAQAVKVETNGDDRALARIALTNAAVMLDKSASNPALDAEHRNAAVALATSYRSTTAKGSVATEAEYQAALNNIITKDAAMRQVCANVGG
nr:hypothetical protein [Mycobacterium spongiae]